MSVSILDLPRPVLLSVLAELGEPTWGEIARPEQLPPPGDWRTWCILAGRGWGKTRTGAETVNRWVNDGQARYVAVVAQTAADARDVSAKAIMHVGAGVRYTPSLRRLEWPNGAIGITFSAEDPDSLRGYEFDAAWSDELAAWRFPDAWDQLQYGLRTGRARQIVTTTPRNIRVIRELLKDPTVHVTRGKTLDNAANLSPEAIAYLLARYAGTRLGRQELDAEILDDADGALWTRKMIPYGHPAQRMNLRTKELTWDLSRIVVAIDPAVTSGEASDETGIVAAGIGADARGYVLADASCRMPPADWARRAINLYRETQADRIVAEANNGGDLVSTVIHTIDPNVPVTLVHASRGKRTRAEPISALYEQGRVSHMEPFPELEDQLCAYTGAPGEDSPDRMDALVWALTEVMGISTEATWGSAGVWGGELAAATA